MGNLRRSEADYEVLKNLEDAFERKDLSYQRPIVRHESTVALSSIGDPIVISELRRAIDDKDEDVRNSALIAYEYLTYLQRKPDSQDQSAKLKIRL